MSDDAAVPPPDGPDESLADVLARTTFAVLAILTRAAAEHGLSLTQLRLLAILRDRRASMSALAEHLGLDRSTLSGLVERARGNGLVARERNARDGRGVDVFLTPDGQALALRLQERVNADLAQLLDPLGAGAQDRLGRLLEQALTGVPHQRRHPTRTPGPAEG